MLSYLRHCGMLLKLHVIRSSNTEVVKMKEKEEIQTLVRSILDTLKSDPEKLRELRDIWAERFEQAACDERIPEDVRKLFRETSKDLRETEDDETLAVHMFGIIFGDLLYRAVGKYMTKSDVHESIRKLSRGEDINDIIAKWFKRKELDDKYGDIHYV